MSKLTEEQKARIQSILYSINEPKHELINFLRTLENTGAKTSMIAKFGRIIGRLEAFQHTKVK